MKNTFKKLLIFSLFIFSLSACDLVNNNNDDKPVDKFLVDYEMVKSYLPELINIAFDQIGDYPELDIIKSKIEHGVIVYRISYYTSFNNQLQKASGLVCVPTGDGPFPLLSYQNGTNTLHSNAPSVNPDYELYMLLESVASTGFVVAIPDYLGFGDADDMYHPYLDKESSNKSILDMLRATKELTDHYLDKDLNDDLYIAGYSQGGWATMQLQHEIETKYMDEFNLKASACGAGPYNLSYINQYITEQTTYPMPYFLGYLFNSYINLGIITIPASNVFQEPYATSISTLYDGTKTGEEINTELTTNIADLLTTDYISNYATDDNYASVVAALEANSIPAWDTEIPTLIIHGMVDDFVPTKVSSDIYQSFLQQGVGIDEVIWLPLPGIGHTTGIIPSGLASISWFLEMEDDGETM